MNKHLKELIELAKNDKTIDSYKPAIEAAEKKVAKVQKKIDAIQEEIDTLNASIKTNEEKITGFEEQIKMLSDQLASNVKKAKDISTEKEMQALSVEEEIAKDKLKFANEEIDRLNGVNDARKSLLEEALHKLQARHEELAAISEVVDVEKAEIEQSKGELFVKREELTRNLEQKVLAFYEKIRLWAGNTAVVPVKKQACYGCYMKLNDKTYAEVIKGEEIVTCPHCGRILYIERETPAEA